MSIDPLGIHLGPFYLRYYGIILVGGAMIGAYIAAVEARRRGLDPNYVWDGLIWALVGGIVGARLYHVFTPPPSMQEAGMTTEYYLNMSNVIPTTLQLFSFKATLPVPALLAIWNGGLGIPGGVAGGVLGLWIYTLRNKLHFPTWLDLAAPGLALAQAIGRWGNYVNNELYGRPTDLPWGQYIPPEYRLPGFTEFERFHPTFLYESTLNLLICVALLYVARRFADSLKPGDVFLLYLIAYPAVRFFLEFIRLDSSDFGNLNINQTLSALIAFVGLLMFAVRHRRQRRARTVSQVTTGD
jgi:phosphatidylglycerol:prolipoprotein diacylglycerol transferase